MGYRVWQQMHAPTLELSKSLNSSPESLGVADELKKFIPIIVEEGQ